MLSALIALTMAMTAIATAPLDAQVEELPAQPQTAEDFDVDKTRVVTADSPIGDSELAALAENNTVAPASATLSIEVHGPDLSAVRSAIESVGGEPYGEVPGFFVEARVPIGGFARLNNSAAVTRLEQVTQVATPVETSLANNPQLASVLGDSALLGQWHSVLHVGEGQKIGILDLFGADELQSAVATNRLPTPAGTFCQQNGRACNINVRGGGAHGVAVAEIIHNAAPRADLYLATVVSTADLAAAIEWFGEQGVTVINRSETSEFDGPGTGTGPTASLIDRAVELDMVWVSASGNAAGRSGREGQNWVGTFNDPDGNGWHNFADGSERMAFLCGFLLGMRWDDWAATAVPTDYDLLIFDTPGTLEPESVADDLQSQSSHVPLEHITPSCNSTEDVDYLSIIKFDDIEPDGADEIQILGNQTVMSEWVNSHSALGPGNDSRNPGAVIVGASTSPTVDTVANFSSQGPTFDGRPAIDLLAPSCLPIQDFFTSCFDGTSASAPVVAGALSVLRGAGVFNPATEVDGLLSAITVDGGQPGTDSIYGYGLLTLPSPQSLGARASIPTCSGVEATIVGTEGNDILDGTALGDVIYAGAGNDRIVSGGGNDVICAGDGADFIHSGQGTNQIFAGPGNDRILASWIRDTVDPGLGNDLVTGQGAQQAVVPSIGSTLWPGSIVGER